MARLISLFGELELLKGESAVDKIVLTLNARSYNVIVQALQEMPWKVAQPVFQEIDPQVRAALAKEEEAKSSEDGVQP